MQGIFEFAGATLAWNGEIHEAFPLSLELKIPHRWSKKNIGLGQWIAEVREQLIRGETIRLDDPRINYRQATDAFDMGALLERLDSFEGSIAAIHCNRTVCNRLARATRGAFQSIEEIAAARLVEFAENWDSAPTNDARVRAVSALLRECVSERPAEDGTAQQAEDDDLAARFELAQANLLATGDISSARAMVSLSREPSGNRVFRSELWKDASRALNELAAGRYETLREAAVAVRQRVSNSGRAPQKRTVSTPLLLKGLEFDHVIIPDASHYVRERQAQAKLFYVAISRATRSLTITSPHPTVQFGVPRY